jgi:hypothetical protein
VEGQPGSGKRSCQEQWEFFKKDADNITDRYLDLQAPTEDPPHTDDNNELRDFYNRLQNLCPADQNPDHSPEVAKQAERFRTSLRETVIRLLYWWNVQKNFSTYYAAEIAQTKRLLAKAGIPTALPPLDGSSGRVEFVKSYSSIDREIRDRLGSIDRQRWGIESTNLSARELDAQEQALEELRSQIGFYLPLYSLEGESSVGDGEDTDAESTLQRGGLPFHWIEAGAVLQPRGAP